MFAAGARGGKAVQTTSSQSAIAAAKGIRDP